MQEVRIKNLMVLAAGVLLISLLIGFFFIGNRPVENSSAPPRTEEDAPSPIPDVTTEEEPVEIPAAEDTPEEPERTQEQPAEAPEPPTEPVEVAVPPQNPNVLRENVITLAERYVSAAYNYSGLDSQDTYYSALDPWIDDSSYLSSPALLSIRDDATAAAEGDSSAALLKEVNFLGQIDKDTEIGKVIEGKGGIAYEIDIVYERGDNWSVNASSEPSLAGDVGTYHEELVIIEWDPAGGDQDNEANETGWLILFGSGSVPEGEDIHDEGKREG